MDQPTPQLHSRVDVDEILNKLNAIQNGTIFNAWTPYLTSLGNLVYQPATNQLLVYDPSQHHQGIDLTLTTHPIDMDDDVGKLLQQNDLTTFRSLSRSRSNFSSSSDTTATVDYLRSSSVVVPTQLLPQLIRHHQHYFADAAAYGKSIPTLCGSIGTIAPSVDLKLETQASERSTLFINQRHLLERVCEELTSSSLVNKLHMLTSSFAIVTVDPYNLSISQDAIDELESIHNVASAQQYLGKWGSHVYTGPMELGQRLIRHGYCELHGTIQPAAGYHAITHVMNNEDKDLIMYLTDLNVSMLCGFIALDPVKSSMLGSHDGELLRQVEELIPTVKTTLYTSIPSDVLSFSSLSHPSSSVKAPPSPPALAHPSTPSSSSPSSSSPLSPSPLSPLDPVPSCPSADKLTQHQPVYQYLVNARNVDPSHWVVTNRPLKLQYLVPIWEIIPRISQINGHGRGYDRQLSLLQQAYHTIKTTPTRQQISTNVLSLLKSLYEKFLYNQYIEAYGLLSSRLSGKVDSHAAKQLYYSIYLHRALVALMNGDYPNVIDYLLFIHQQVEAKDFVFVECKEVVTAPSTPKQQLQQQQPSLTLPSSSFSTSQQHTRLALTPTSSARPSPLSPSPASPSPLLRHTQLSKTPSSTGFHSLSSSTAPATPTTTKCYVDVPLIPPFMFYDEINRLPPQQQQRHLFPLSYFIAHNPILSSDVKQHLPPLFSHLFGGQPVYIMDCKNEYYLRFESSQVYGRSWGYTPSNPPSDTVMNSFRWQFRCCNDAGDFIDSNAIAELILKAHETKSSDHKHHVSHTPCFRSQSSYSGPGMLKSNPFEMLFSCGIYFRVVNYASGHDLQTLSASQNKDALVHAKYESQSAFLPSASLIKPHMTHMNSPIPANREEIPSSVMDSLPYGVNQSLPGSSSTSSISNTNHTNNITRSVSKSSLKSSTSTSRNLDGNTIFAQAVGQHVWIPELVPNKPGRIRLRLASSGNYLKIEQGRWKQMYVHGGGGIPSDANDALRFEFELHSSPKGMEP